MTFKVKGKIVTEALPTPAFQKKAEREIAEFRRFEQLMRQFLEVNAQICRARPVEQSAPVSQEKNDGGSLRNNRPSLRASVPAHFRRLKQTGQLDLEAVGMAIRSTVHQTGASAVTELLRFDLPDSDHRTIPCACGHGARYQAMRSRPILTAVGWASIERPYYWCPQCRQGQFPADVQLDIHETLSPPGVRRMPPAVGSETAFAPAHHQLKLLADLEVTVKTMERTAESIGADIEARQQQDIQCAKQLCLPEVAVSPIPHLYVQMDGAQVFMVKSETAGRASRTPGQPARTRECKLGCVFTQTGVDEKRRPVRDEASMTYVGAIETAEEFGLRIYTEAWNRGWDAAAIRVVMGDGSHWIWNVADQHFPGAIQIVELEPAEELKPGRSKELQKANVFH